MTRTLRVTQVLLVGMLLCGLSAASGAATYGLLTDDERVTNSVSTADSFSFPKDAVAYDDADGDGQWDTNEDTYTKSDLTSLTDHSVHLNFHKDANNLKNTNLDVEVASISIDQKLKVQQASTIRLKAVTGNVDLRNAAFKQVSSVTVNSTTGNIDISDATFQQISSLKMRALDGNIVKNSKTKCKQISSLDLKDQDGTVSC